MKQKIKLVATIVGDNKDSPYFGRTVTCQQCGKSFLVYMMLGWFVYNKNGSIASGKDSLVDVCLGCVTTLMESVAHTIQKNLNNVYEYEGWEIEGITEPLKEK